MYLASVMGVPFSFVGHAVDIFERRYLLRRKLERAAFVSCISLWHREFYREIHDRPDAEYPVIRCGVDTDAWRPSSDTRVAGHVLAVGRLVRKKGFDLLVQALMDVPQADRVTIVGDGPERAALERQIRTAGLSEKVTLTGALGNEAIRELMLQATCFALPCRVLPGGDRDGIPVVLMEAMACGLPVVAGDLPAIRELVVDGETGFLCPTGDVAALAGRLRELVAGDASATWRRFAETGRRRVSDEFGQRANVERLIAAIERAGNA